MHRPILLRRRTHSGQPKLDCSNSTAHNTNESPQFVAACAPKCDLAAGCPPEIGAVAFGFQFRNQPVRMSAPGEKQTLRRAEILDPRHTGDKIRHWSVAIRQVRHADKTEAHRRSDCQSAGGISRKEPRVCTAENRTQTTTAATSAREAMILGSKNEQPC